MRNFVFIMAHLPFPYHATYPHLLIRCSSYALCSTILYIHMYAQNHYWKYIKYCFCFCLSSTPTENFKVLPLRVVLYICCVATTGSLSSCSHSTSATSVLNILVCVWPSVQLLTPAGHTAMHSRAHPPVFDTAGAAGLNRSICAAKH